MLTQGHLRRGARGAGLALILLGCVAIAVCPVFGANNSTSFRDRFDYATSISFTGAVGDLNGDGTPDLFLCGEGAQTWFGTGTGGFSPEAQLINIGNGNFCYVPVLLDLNGDGKLDVVMAFSGIQASGLSVALGNGDGTFQSDGQVA